MENNEQATGPQQYDQLVCPNCKCLDVYVGELAEAAVKNELLPPKAVQFAMIVQGMVPPKAIADKLPLGSTVASYMMGFDVCKECHTMYARKVIIAPVTKKPMIVKPSIIMPGDIDMKGRNN